MFKTSAYYKGVSCWQCHQVPAHGGNCWIFVNTIITDGVLDLLCMRRILSSYDFGQNLITAPGSTFFICWMGDQVSVGQAASLGAYLLQEVTASMFAKVSAE